MMDGRLPSPQLALDFRWDTGADLASLVTGDNGEVVAVAAAAARVAGAPLHLHGPAGAGKSHLLQGVCGAATDAGRTAFYLPLAAMRDYPPQVLEGLEGVALVAVDDVGAVAGDRAWEEALFHLYNRLRDAGTQLITVARHPPEALGLGLPDLVSRLQWGLVYAVKPLDDAGRLAALRQRAERRGLALPAASARYLIERYPRDATTVFAQLDRLDEASLRAGRRLTVPFIREVLGPPPAPERG